MTKASSSAVSDAHVLMRCLSPRRCAIIFDLDGTLVDSAIGIAAALNEVGLASEPITVDRVRALVSKGAAHLVKETLGVSDAEVPDALRRFREIYMVDLCQPEHLFPDVERLLDCLLRWGLSLAVCTNKPQALAEGVIHRLGLTPFFSSVVGADPSRPEKPDPTPLREVVSQLNGGTAIFVGDSMIDARTAEAAGTPFIYAAYGYERVAGIPVAGVAFDCMGVAATIESLLWPSTAVNAKGD
jgi:phosphoglycolate phosphatase